MDKLDYKILNILKENGRETASDISKAIHLSVSAVLDRIKKMEESGIIKGYTVRVDAKALGNDVTALMEISLEHPRFHDSFTEVIMDHPPPMSWSASTAPSRAYPVCLPPGPISF